MTPRPTTSKLLLIAEGRPATDGGLIVPVRRYRLARVAASDSADTPKVRKERRLR